MMNFSNLFFAKNKTSLRASENVLLGFNNAVITPLGYILLLTAQLITLPWVKFKQILSAAEGRN